MRVVLIGMSPIPIQQLFLKVGNEALRLIASKNHHRQSEGRQADRLLWNGASASRLSGVRLQLELHARSRGGKQGGFGEKIGVGSAVFIGSSCPEMAGFGGYVVVSLPA